MTRIKELQEQLAKAKTDKEKKTIFEQIKKLKENKKVEKCIAKN